MLRKIKDTLKNNHSETTSSKSISWIIFLFSIIIVLISFVSVVFPALILVSNTVIIPEIESITPNPYEFGIWSTGLIISNVIIFGLTFLYLTNRLPITISNALKRLFAFEISKKIAIISITILLIIYITASVSELSTEENFEDYKNVKNRVEGWSIDQAFGSFEPHVRYFLISTSMILFGNFKIIPFLASIALLITTLLQKLLLKKDLQVLFQWLFFYRVTYF